MARAIKGIPSKDLRGLVDEGKKQLGSGIVALVGVSDDGRAGVAVGVTDDLTRVDTTQLSSSGSPPRRWAAKAVAAGRTWRRPVVRMAPRPMRPSRPS